LSAIASRTIRLAIVRRAGWTTSGLRRKPMHSSDRREGATPRERGQFSRVRRRCSAVDGLRLARHLGRIGRGHGPCVMLMGARARKPHRKEPSSCIGRWKKRWQRRWQWRWRCCWRRWQDWLHRRPISESRRRSQQLCVRLGKINLEQAELVLNSRYPLHPLLTFTAGNRFIGAYFPQ